MTEEEENSLHARMAETILNTPQTITVDVKAQSVVHEFLMRLKLLKRQRKYKITGATYGTLLKCVPLLNGIKWESPPEKDEPGHLDHAYKMVQVNADNLKKVICHCIHNKRSDYPKKLERMIEDNFTSQDVHKVALSVITKLDVLSFSNTIGSIRSLSPLKKFEKAEQKKKSSPSLKNEGEIIAHSEPLVTLKGLFDGAKTI